MTRITYHAEWAGERAAGINPGSEDVTIEFRHGQPVDADVLNFWKDSIAEFYDGGTVVIVGIQDNLK